MVLGPLFKRCFVALFDLMAIKLLFTHLTLIEDNYSENLDRCEYSPNQSICNNESPQIEWAGVHGVVMSGK